MTTPEIIFLALVIVLGVPASLRNPTAVGLALAFLAVPAMWHLTTWGKALLEDDFWRVYVSLILDSMVVAIIYMKPPAFDLYPYATQRDYLRAAFWFELSYWDRIVLGIYPFVWFTYVASVSEHARWWTLYWCALAQLLAATGESAENFLKRRKANAANKGPDNPSPGAMLSWAGMRGYG